MADTHDDPFAQREGEPEAELEMSAVIKPSAEGGLLGETEAKRLDFSSPVYRDRAWAWVFWASFVAVVIMGIVFGSQYSPSPGLDDQITEHMWQMSGIFTGVGIVVAAFWLFMVKKFSHVLVWLSMLLSCVMWGVLTVGYFAAGYAGMGIFCGLALLLNILYVYLVRSRIAFAVVMLKLTTSIIKAFPATITVSFVSVLVQAGWYLVWAIAMFYSLDTLYANRGWDFATGLVYFLLVLAYLWTATVIRYVVHVTVAGLTATWYFLDPSSMPANPTKGALKRALTTSFGTICMGSFLIAFLQTVRFMVYRMYASDNNFLRCCALCILNCLNALLRYFTHYVFTYVAIYGKAFIPAAKDTVNLFRARLLDTIINDDLTSGVLTLACLMGGLMLMGLGYLVGTNAYDMADWVLGTWVAVGFFVGYLLTSVVMVPVQSAIASIFVCFSEDPMALYSTKPAEFNMLTSAWAERYPKVVFWTQAQSQHQHGQSHYTGPQPQTMPAANYGTSP